MDKIQKTQTLNIAQVLESRPKIVHDEKKIIGPSHKSIFNGAALVEWLLNNYNPTNTNREGLVKLVQEELFDPTLGHQLIYPVGDVTEFKDSEKALYRFIDDQFKEFKKDRSLLNLNGVDTSANPFFYEQIVPLSILDVQNELKHVVEDLFSSYLDESKILVNYIGIEESDTFNKFLAIVTKLAFADMTPIIGDTNEIKSFFINIYNILVIHGMIAHHWTKKKMDINLLERMDFYASYKYNIGGHNYTLNDIEHGILRKNSPLGMNAALNVVQLALGPKAAEEKHERFKEKDPRRKFVLPVLDPRIHFALNMGTISSPALRYYDAQDVDLQLEYAARDYCDRHSILKVEKDKAHFEFLDFFKHYKLDFVLDDRSLIYYLLSYKKDGEEKDIMMKMFDEQKVNIKWKKFAWDLNKTNATKFSYHSFT